MQTLEAGYRNESRPMLELIATLPLLDFDAVVGWMDDHEGTGAWVQGFLTLLSITLVGVISISEGRHAYRMHLEALEAQYRQEERRLKGIQVAAMNVAEFASDRFRKATLYARDCDGLLAIDDVWAPDFEVIRSTVATLPIGELQDPHLIKHLGQVMISCISMQRHLATLDRVGRRDDLTNELQKQEAERTLALMDKECLAIRFHNNRVGQQLGLVRERDVWAIGPTTAVTKWNRLKGRVAALFKLPPRDSKRRRS